MARNRRDEPVNSIRTAARVLLAAFTLTTTACAHGEPTATTRPGDPAFYDRISATTDCMALQDEFDQADRAGPSDWQLAYMLATSGRMTKLGCPQ